MKCQAKHGEINLGSGSPSKISGQIFVSIKRCHLKVTFVSSFWLFCLSLLQRGQRLRIGLVEFDNIFWKAPPSKYMTWTELELCIWAVTILEEANKIVIWLLEIPKFHFFRLWMAKNDQRLNLLSFAEFLQKFWIRRLSDYTSASGII